LSSDIGRELYTTDCGIAASLLHPAQRRQFANRAESGLVYTALNLGCNGNPVSLKALVREEERSMNRFLIERAIPGAVDTVCPARCVPYIYRD